jgi:citrate synthase
MTVTFLFDNKSVELPVKEGTLGPSGLDISKLYGQTGMFTYDPGFTSTAATESKITYIDGDQGILLYRGYPIDTPPSFPMFRCGMVIQSLE